MASMQNQPNDLHDNGSPEIDSQHETAGYGPGEPIRERVRKRAEWANFTKLFNARTLKWLGIIGLLGLLLVSIWLTVSSVSRTQSQLGDMAARVSRLEAQVANMAAQIAEVVAKFSHQISELKSTVNTMTGEIQALKEMYTIVIQPKITSTEARESRLELNVEQNTRSVKELNTRMAELNDYVKGKLAELEKEVGKHATQIADIKTQVREDFHRSDERVKVLERNAKSYPLAWVSLLPFIDRLSTIAKLDAAGMQNLIKALDTDDEAIDREALITPLNDVLAAIERLPDEEKTRFTEVITAIKQLVGQSEKLEKKQLQAAVFQLFVALVDNSRCEQLFDDIAQNRAKKEVDEFATQLIRELKERKAQRKENLNNESGAPAMGTPVPISSATVRPEELVTAVDTMLQSQGQNSKGPNKPQLIVEELFDSLRRPLHDLQNRMQKLESEIQEVKPQIEDLKSHIKQWEAKLAALEDRAPALEKCLCRSVPGGFAATCRGSDSDSWRVAMEQVRHELLEKLEDIRRSKAHFSESDMKMLASQVTVNVLTYLSQYGIPSQGSVSPPSTNSAQIDNTLPPSPNGSAIGIPTLAFSEGVAALRHNQFNRAVDLLMQAVRADARNPTYRFYLAVALRRVGRLEEARAQVAAGCKLEKSGSFVGVGQSLERLQGEDRVWLENARLGL